MFGKYFKKAAAEEVQPYIMWRDGSRTSRGPNPLYKPQNGIDFSTPARSGNRLTRVARTLAFAAAATAALHATGVADKMADGIQAVNHHLSNPSV